MKSVYLRYPWAGSLKVKSMTEKKKKKIELLQKFLEKLQKFEYSFLVR